jgi:uncharacterized protein YbbC (DUF1343 family)
MFRFGWGWKVALAGILAMAGFRAAFFTPVHAFQAGPEEPAPAKTLPGIDVLEAAKFDVLQGKRVAVITNQTGVDSTGRRTIDVVAHAPGVTLVAIFSPEHGIAGRADENVANAKDEATGLPIYSLYGDTRRPTDAMLAGIDTLVFDVQDAGVRFYTYTTTMAYCMEEAAKRHIEFVVLDRPDILGGEVIEGPILDADKTSFVGYFSMPVRYAMTLGELARMWNAENKIGADLRVVEMKNWQRGEAYDETGLAWIPPSPNLRSVDAAFLYPGIEILQAGDISVGRGTDTPFELFGAPWIDGKALAARLDALRIPGVRFRSVAFRPASGVHAGELCEGVTIQIVDRGAIRSVTMSLAIAETLKQMYPKDFKIDKIIELLGSEATLAELKSGGPPAQIEANWEAGLEKFRTMRAKYLIYH